MDSKEIEIVSIGASSSQKLASIPFKIRNVKSEIPTTKKEELSPIPRYFTRVVPSDFEREIRLQTQSGVTKEKILVLDLDETLIHSTKKQPAHFFADKVELYSNNTIYSFWVTKRPGLKSFLQEMSQVYEIVIYTAGTADYAEAVLKELGLLSWVSRIFHREHCFAVSDSAVIKDLSVISRNLQNIILIDDVTHNVERQPQNSLQIVPFEEDLNDRWLATIAPFLQKLAKCDDVRSVSRKFELFMLGRELPQGNCEEVIKPLMTTKPNKKRALNIADESIGSESCLDESIDEGITSTAVGQIERLAFDLAVKKGISE